MKFTQKLKKEVMAVYQAYWDSYLKGDMKTMASFLDEGFNVIGSTDGEVFFNKEDAMKFYSATADQIAGKAEFRNRKISIEPVNGIVLITEVSDFYIRIEDDWQFYSKARLSSTLRRKADRWKFIQQHGSIPDSKTREGEQIAFEKISRENLELRDAVKRRTVELENKNRELEIETALEKVRSSALAMKEPADMVEVCRIISDQLELLGVTNLRHVQTVLIDEQKGTFLNYEYFTQYKTTNILEVEIKLHPVVEEFATEITKSKDSFFTKTFEGDELRKWIRYRKETNQIEDPVLENSKSVHYYFHSIGPGALGLSSYAPFNEKDIAVFNRFHNVFALAYQRFIDIEQAIAQARETQIEAALERVRAVAMGMNKHDDLLQICESSFVELKKLGFENLRNVVIHIPYDEENYFMDYDFSDFTGGQIGKVDYGLHPIVDEYLEKIRSAEDAFFEVEIDGDMLAGWNDFRRESGQMYDQRLDTANALYYYLFSIGIGDIGISTFKPINDSQIKTLKKFRNVFRLTYKRYTDITLAAAQAREAQVEAALERIRSQALGMRNSEDIGNVSDSFFTEFNNLTVKLLGCTIAVVDEAKDSMELWRARSGVVVKPFDSISFSNSMQILKKNLPDWYPVFISALKKRNKFLMDEVSGEKRVQAINSMAEQSNYSNEEKARLFKAIPDSFVTYYIYFKLGYLALITEEKLPDENVAIARRFVNVFGFAYTRFLDIKKAEARAREAQIEAALERVRSRTMAMRRSDELAETSFLLAQQVRELGIQAWGCAFHIYADDEEGDYEWFSNEDGYLPTYKTPRKNFFKRFYDKGQQGEELLVEEFKGAKCTRHYEFLMTLAVVGDALKDLVKSGISLPTSQIDHVAFFKHGYLLFITYEQVTEAHNIFRRFAKEFEQTYTRFLDLQRAEALARKTEIELSLERVRARAMAIHESHELAEVIQIIFMELNSLGFDTLECSLVTYDTNPKDLVYWSAGPFGAAASNVKLQHIDHPILVDLFKDLAKGIKYRSGEIAGELLKTWWDRIFSETDFKYAPKEFIESWKKVTRVNYVQVVMNHGFIEFVGQIPLSKDKVDILKRFTKVVDLTYTRYDDVLKAEAQAREAQIEAALERIRSRTMGMQKSNELKEVIRVVYEQFVRLKINVDHAGFVVDYKPKGDWHFWIADEQDIPSKITHPYFESVWANQFNEAKEKRADFFATNLSFEEKNKFYNELLSYVPGLPEASKDFYLNCPGLAGSTVLLDNVSLYIENFSGIPYSDEENNILLRFGKVFQQTYTRFLDLQKAEAQAREAQIEVAVERVRAKALAMHKSEEILAVVVTLKNELMALDIPGVAAATIHLQEEDGSVRMWDLSSVVEMEQGFQLTLDVKFRLEETDPDFFVRRVWESDEKYFVVKQDEHDLAVTVAWLRQYQPEMADEVSKFLAANEIKYLLHPTVKLANGRLCADLLESVPDEMESILAKMGAAFDLAYKRFFDLQKAEAQAREVQIELGLERVRARAMAMQHSGELSALVDTLFQELTRLDFALTFCIINIINEGDRSNTVWAANPETGKDPESYYMKFEDYKFHHEMWKAWKAQKIKWVYTLEGREKKIYDEYLYNDTEFRRFPKNVQDESRALKRYVASFTFSNFGGLQTVGEEPLSDASLEILARFGKVFDLTYTRFNDLQQAEEQAREAQIEAALERVRSRTMGMQRSDELSDVIAVVSNQLQHLKLRFDHVSFAINSDAEDYHFWTSVYGQSRPYEFIVPYLDNPIANRTKKFRSQGLKFFQDTLTPEENRAWLEHAFKHNLADNLSPKEKTHALSHGFSRSVALMPNILLAVGNYASEPYSEDENEIIRRFAAVFEQSYTRFLDLKKAEEQAREAQIEAALERVRARTMGMHQSDELQGVISGMFEQLKKLDFVLDVCALDLIEKGSKDLNTWTASTQQIYVQQGRIPYFNHALINTLVRARKKPGSITALRLLKPEIRSWYKHVIANSPFGSLMSAERKRAVMNAERWDLTFAIAKQTGLIIGNFRAHEYTDAENRTALRFSQVFEQTYTRFLDLKKAEEQARNAQIEAALERVRAKAMAMHHSQDLATVVSTVFGQLKTLEINMLRCGIGLIDGRTRKADLWTTTLTDKGDSVQVSGDEPLEGHPLLEGIFESWKQQQDLSYILQGEDLRHYYKFVGETNFQLPAATVTSKAPTDAQQYYYCAMFPAGGLYAVRETEFSAEAMRLIRRFADVFHLAYTRYQDLQKAEARAREAEQQASLDRVRAEIASMRTAADLQRITPLIWRELTTLGVPFFRCGVFIIDEADELAHLYLSTPSGKSLAALPLKFGSTPLVKQTVRHWRQQEVYRDEWNRKQFIEWTQSLIEQRLIDSPEKYQAGEEAPEKLALLLVPFTQGMLYVGSAVPLSDDEIDLAKTLADAFAVAYARYEDFQKLETAKLEVEAALDNLQKTQSQLVQAEKMASLGQLTAGIAHEIKNPLNFVNNFAELSGELLEELRQEIEKQKGPDGDPQEIKALLHDLQQNAQKINEHGKRADSIVKGMLQHSRGGKGERQPVDLNAMLEEDLNLAYHGMRAQDSSFNVTMEKQFDPKLGKVDVVPQNISRVFLNIITNGFHAVHERRQKSANDFSPKLLVKTRLEKDKVVIRIKDNGSGIPADIRENIFQPFFTTKPTGQGTGLGLSISYDIVVQEHHGEIRVDSQEGKFTEFIIKLPGNGHEA